MVVGILACWLLLNIILVARTWRAGPRKGVNEKEEDGHAGTAQARDQHIERRSAPVDGTVEAEAQQAPQEAA